ncbi:MAG TPA: hypothetical protein VL728_14480 [Cyclobacteriaceae bacterium]|nr:hypothetical protein [Cyclobacteriaceae bacterium]
MLKSLSIALSVAIHFTLSAQDYAVTLKGDTLRGKLKPYSFDNLDRLQVTSKDKKKTSYTAIQVKKFVKDGVTYQPIKYENAIRFMKVIKSGYLSLYAYSTNQQNLFDGRYLLKRDDSGVDLPNISFKRILAKYLGDCPQVKSKVENGDLHKSDIEKIVDEYNTCIEANTIQIMATTNATGTTGYRNEKIEAIKKLRENVEAENFLTKKDVVDLLNDMQNKLSRNEAVPNYLTDGLKSYLTDTPTLSKKADELIALLKK